MILGLGLFRFFDFLQRAIFLDKTSLDMKNCDPPWELETSYSGFTCTVLAVYPAIQMLNKSPVDNGAMNSEW